MALAFTPSFIGSMSVDLSQKEELEVLADVNYRRDQT